MKMSLVPDIDMFDAAFFGISAAEASLMDPQHRMVLEETWHALEHAGILPSNLRGKSVSVTIGQCACDYVFASRSSNSTFLVPGTL
jgi:acyl transferase domain-containing protein